MNWFLLLKSIHVVSAITAVGANLTYGAWTARGTQSRETLGFALRGIKFLDDRIANPAYGVLLLTGLLMAIFYVGFHLWVYLGLGIFVLLAVLGVAVITPALARQIALADSAYGSPEYDAAAARTRGVGMFLGALALAVVFVMVFKPQ